MLESTQRKLLPVKAYYIRYSCCLNKQLVGEIDFIKRWTRRAAGANTWNICARTSARHICERYAEGGAWPARMRSSKSPPKTYTYTYIYECALFAIGYSLRAKVQDRVCGTSAVLCCGAARNAFAWVGLMVMRSIYTAGGVQYSPL